MHVVTSTAPTLYQRFFMSLRGDGSNITLPSTVTFVLQIKRGSWANGIKLTSALLLYQLLMQFLRGFDHEREALGAPFPDARLHPMWANGVDEQGA
jgi:hypothetical protein